MYESRTAFTTVQKAHIVEWFSGVGTASVPNVNWVFQNIVGSGSGAMVNAICGGYRLTTGATSGNRASLHYGANNPAHFSCSGAVVIAITERITGTTAGMANGLTDQTAADFAATCCDSLLAVKNDTNGTAFVALTVNDGCAGVHHVDTSTASHTNRFSSKLELNACCATLILCGGCVDSTQACGGLLPTAAMQPFFYSRTFASGARESRIHYMEAYNT